MKATILVAAFVACWTNVYAEDCNKPCRTVDPTTDDPGKNPCGHANLHYGGPGCQCDVLERDGNNELFKHKTNTKILIDHSNNLHMYCHNSGCLRFQYCRITIHYVDTAIRFQDGSYELPAYGDCCHLPSGFINDGTIHDIGF